MLYEKNKRGEGVCEINTVDAIGHVLCHDITRIIKDEVKDTLFVKGIL